MASNESSDEMSSSSADGRSAGSARTWTVSRRWSSVPPSFSIAIDSPTLTTGTSTVISSVILTM